MAVQGAAAHFRTYGRLPAVVAYSSGKCLPQNQNMQIFRSPRLAGADPASLPLEADTIEDWLDALPPDGDADTARRLCTMTERVAGMHAPGRERHALLALLREKTEGLLPRMEHQLARPPLPLPPGLRAAVIATNDLLKTLALAYTRLASEAASGWRCLGARPMLHAALPPAMRLHRRRLELAYRVYARGSGSIWTGLHRLYRLALDEGMDDAVCEEVRESPRAIYRKALLLAFADAGRLAPGEMDRVCFYLDRHAELARLEPPGPPERAAARFLVRTAEPHPGVSLTKLREADRAAGDLQLDCAPLVERVQLQIAGLEQGRQPADLGLPLIAARPEYVVMLRKLAGAWNGSRSRRHARSRFDPRIDAVLGFPKLWNFVSSAAFRRRRGDPAAAVHELMQWTIVNESPDGYALRYLGGAAGQVPVGEILGIRTCDRSAVHIALLRRACCSGEALEVGVQVLATQSRPATITVRGAAPVRAIYLPAMPAIGAAAGLLAPPAGLHPGLEFALNHEGRQRLMRIARRLERAASCDLFALEEASVSATPPA